MHSYRIWFTKQGAAQYISHLDLNRCMARAVRRAALPIWYTEGFNPHPFLHFATALPLGVQSLCECVDVKSEAELDLQDTAARLNAVMPQGIQITRVTTPQQKPSAIAFAQYRIQMYFDRAEVPKYIQRLETALAGSLTTMKRSKKGEKLVDLQDFVQKADIHAEQDHIVLQVTLAAGSEQNCSAILFADTLQSQAEMSPESRSILREKLLTKENQEFC